ncbi:hypothetical protein E4665_03760 [Sporolactobacillus shoreae]|uniref:Chromosome partitioning protein ParB n=1 Tax=Sporolactobacillus shoreae TaxID=1465501 RepID=A0A4Z0GRH4_9BACL|nr:ParB/Srx family N-terminal domain-containing protein [Sporolactobacillus shoreae]TGA99451.1 hypothetical protein E4665_03760 [Sporolactobacillus shoreae]
MKRLIVSLVSILSLFFLSVVPGQAEENVNYQIPIQDLHPTQAALGKVQLAAKLSTYIDSNNNLTSAYYSDFNDDNGYLNGNYVDQNGQTISAKKTFYKTASIYDVVEQVSGVGPTVPSTPAADVVIGPGHIYYLVDGHHGVSEYLFVHQMTGKGDTSVNVKVLADWSNLKTNQFWNEMKAQHYYYPKAYDAKTRSYKTIDRRSLPQTIGVSYFINDPFRGLNYFWRKSAINKDAISAPFAEFYWGEFLTATGQFKDLSFNSDADYITAFNRGNQILKKLINGDSKLTALFKKTITDSYGYTETQLGLQNTFDDSAISGQLSKLQSALAYADNQPKLTDDENTISFLGQGYHLGWKHNKHAIPATQK